MTKTIFNSYSESVIDILKTEFDSFSSAIKKFTQKYSSEVSSVRRREERYEKKVEFLPARAESKAKQIPIQKKTYFIQPVVRGGIDSFPIDLDEDEEELSLLTAAAAVAAGAVGTIMPNGDNGRLNPSQLKDVGGGYKLWTPAANSFLAMVEDAKRDGITIIVNSAYRTYEEQAELVRRLGAWSPTNPGAAPPGSSKHGMGTAVDIDPPEAREWVGRNGRRYGWIPTVPNEPWHFEYIGGGAASKVEPQKHSSVPIDQKISGETNIQPIVLVSQDVGRTYEESRISTANSQISNLNNTRNPLFNLQMHSTYGIG